MEARWSSVGHSPTRRDNARAKARITFQGDWCWGGTCSVLDEEFDGQPVKLPETFPVMAVARIPEYLEPGVGQARDHGLAERDGCEYIPFSDSE